MPERIDWLDDGTAGGSPYSPRFADRYRSELGGLVRPAMFFSRAAACPRLGPISRNGVFWKPVLAWG